MNIHQKSDVGMGRPPSPLQDTHGCVTGSLRLFLFWGPPDTLASSRKYLLPHLYFL